MRVRVDNEYKYYNFKFEEKTNKEVLTTNTIFLDKKDGKYGFVNKNGIVVVDYIYDDAREQNEYGYASVKKNGMWGCVNQKGKVVITPAYQLENNPIIEFIGKWHLGDGERFTPNIRGFDEFYGFLGGGHKYFPEQFNKMYLNQVQAGKYPINGYLLPLKHNKETVDEKEYITDALSREAINSINMSKDKKKPFFIYLAYNAPHVPLEAKIEDLAQFPDIKDNDRKIYAAMVYAVDRGVGDIVKTLRANNQLDNTLIVFLSDNGGNTDHGANNDPLKGTKGDTWEGGYRTPMFFHWPAKIQAGKRYDDLVSALDLYPTFVNMAGAKLPKGKVLDGVDIMNDVIDGKAKDKERMIFALRYREGYSDVGVRQGDWKATRMGNEPWGLYNVSKDMGEHKDLGGQFPDRLKTLVAAAEKWSQTHVKPLWVYSQTDEELWNNGFLPNYKATFEVDKLIAPPSNYKLTK